jgi:RNA-directed DNA polymerase
VVDLDIRGFFDNPGAPGHAVRKHTDCPWVLLYIERWLKAPVEAEDGSLIARDKGTPQGGVASPLLANIFLHHVFDTWMGREHPGCPFERYADDVVIHCRSYEEALAVKASVEARLRQCRLEAHPDKTRIVYCRDSNRPDGHPHTRFDFLGYSFRPRAAKNGRTGTLFTGFLPALSVKAVKAINEEVRTWRIHRRSQWELEDLSRMFNPIIRGWVHYYGRYYPTALRRAFRCLNQRLVRWARGKHKRFRNKPAQAAQWLRQIAARQPELFAHWQTGIVP